MQCTAAGDFCVPYSPETTAAALPCYSVQQIIIVSSISNALLHTRLQQALTKSTWNAVQNMLCTTQIATLQCNRLRRHTQNASPNSTL
jgi:hypothetical protein